MGRRGPGESRAGATRTPATTWDSCSSRRARAPGMSGSRSPASGPRRPRRGADGESVVLVLPQTFMNASGQAVGELVRGLRLEPERLLVVYDDVDLPLGEIRIRKDGGPGTHKGMASIVLDVGTTRFPAHPRRDRARMPGGATSSASSSRRSGGTSAKRLAESLDEGPGRFGADHRRPTSTRR